MKMIHAFACSLLLVTVAFAQRPAQGAHGADRHVAGGVRRPRQGRQVAVWYR